MTAISRRRRTCPRCHGQFEGGAAFCPRDGTRLVDDTEPESAPDPYLGRVIADDIVLESVAGSGAMGRVYRAHQRGIERDVAVKILHRELSSNTQLVARFHREAKIASKLQHPHVVEVYLAGQLPDGALYIVMEYLDGQSLAGALGLADGGKLPLDRALAIMLQICDAVGEGHARGIVHRDLKPENIMLVRRADVADWVKVLDFGIAKLTIGEQSMETAAGIIFGTARYISPEGAQGRPVGPAGDVYALATMLYQLLVGRTPFEAEPLGLLVKHIHETPPDIRTVNPDGRAVPDPLARLVMDNLAKEPSGRAQTARAFAGLLAAAARSAAIAIPDVGLIARVSHLPSPALEPTLDDAAAVPVPAPEPVVIRTPAPPPPAPVAPAPMTEKVAAAGRASISAPLVVLAFLLGSAITAVAIFRLVVRPDAERHAYHERTRTALVEGHYNTPPNENVRDLVAAGMARWPDDVELRQMRSEAEKQMIMLAITARASGDLVGARNLARDALTLESTDYSARNMRSLCDEDLHGALSGATARTGPPRLVFESPPVVKAHSRVEMTGRIIWGAVAPKAELPGMTVSLLPNGKTTGGVPVMFDSTDPNAIKAHLTAPGSGSYDVAFEAIVDGTVVRAMRDLDVIP